MTYYVIYRLGYGNGLNSILSGFLGHIHICESKGYVPVIDMRNHPSIYTESQPILGTTNMWEYYFEPLNKVTLEEAYASAHWLDSEGRYPSEVMESLVYGTPWLLDTFDRNIRLRSETEAALNISRARLGVSRKLLGVHFRGTDMRTTAGHPMPPTEEQLFKRVDMALNNNDFEKIFLVSEHQDYVKAFERRYGARLTYMDGPRKGATNSIAITSEAGDRYRLGLEVLLETLLLSECGGLISGYSGLSEMSRVLSRGEYRVSDQVWNGRLRGGRLGSKYLWDYRSSAPRFLGGFKP